MRNFKLLIGLISLSFGQAFAQIPIEAWDFEFFQVVQGAPQLISHPPGARKLLLAWREEGRRTCFFYKIPRQGKGGRLFVQYQSNSSDCSWAPQLKNRILLEDLSSLQIAYSQKRGGLKLAYKKGELFQEVFWPMFNLQKKVDWERYSSGAPERFIPGVFFPGNGEGKQNLLGALEDNYKDGTAILCHGFNEKCQETKAFQCDLCRYGWFEIVGYGCSSGERKFCGQDRCGEHGQPACPRGFRYGARRKGSRVCQNDSPAVFCQEGLRALCDSQKILICR